MCTLRNNGRRKSCPTLPRLLSEATRQRSNFGSRLPADFLAGHLIQLKASQKQAGMVGEHLDLTSDEDGDGDGRQAGDGPHAEQFGRTRPFLGIRFVCCDVYARIYANRELTAFQGHCPRCSRPVVVKIEPGGSTERFFEAG